MDVTPTQIAALVALQPVAVGPTTDPTHRLLLEVEWKTELMGLCSS